MTMVSEAMASTELSSDLKHQKVQNSEPLQEHTGIYRATSYTLHHLKYISIFIVTTSYLENTV